MHIRGRDEGARKRHRLEGTSIREGVLVCLRRGDGLGRGEVGAEGTAVQAVKCRPKCTREPVSDAV